jgi:hypothetical protein
MLHTQVRYIGGKIVIAIAAIAAISQVQQFTDFLWQ